ncbi:hypothetical protein POSPLADRAFT_1137777 [Postia placenta MAD-698-R-SB12]|uniref:Restriction of telomere capping protein 4 n=1 Tax=Postia placenta MAD-698-R-SB12 TaxID=670580 RepID=A0A1X6N6M4_9APHY|nr:hypothetical protein POSPLADRAFT_1137777 [Postia placenta MAD-698-R-SB12]OSX64116.1 hypothetical protein POSPLADRAFT_1137777 [Postia placenta MAD-698-R-SB12]
MENFQDNLRRRGTTLHSDTSHDVRCKTRPLPSAQTKGKGFEDLGSSFARPSKQPPSSQSRVTRSQDKGEVKVATRDIRTTIWDTGSEDSDDELDMLSRRSISREVSFSPGTSSKKPTASQKPLSNNQGVVIDGQFHEYNPAFLPKKSLPSFRKNKKGLDADTGSGPLLSQPSTSSARVTAESSTSRFPTPEPSGSSQPRKASGARPKPRAAHAGTRKLALETSPPPPPKRTSARKGRREQNSPLNELSSNHDRPSSELIHHQDIEDDPKTPRPQRPRPRPVRKGARTPNPQPFPMPPPFLDSGDEDTQRMKDRKGVNGKGKAKEQCNPIEALSPLSSQKHNDRLTPPPRPLLAFPELSPLSSVHQDSPSQRCKVLESIGHSPGKRLSEDDCDVVVDEEAQRERKRRRANPNAILAELMRGDGDDDLDEDDLLFLDPEVDPKTLCPWCDERLPPVPTPYLSTLIAIAKQASWPDLRPSNSLGLRAPLGAFVGVCQRHRFESHQVPLAKRRGWPTEIEWDRVGARVAALKPRLQAILDDIDEDFLPGASRKEEYEEDGQYADRPRKGSVFWRDVVKSVRKKGSRQTAGVAGQFASFDKTQPGYYGELGYMIINQTIYNLFPPASFHADSTLPLTPTDFIALVLVPEAAVSLITEDMKQTRQEAIATLRESAEYGVAMFPDDHDSADAVSAGERIIMERARVRRKELEEAGDEGFWTSMDEVESSQLQDEGKRKGRRRKAQGNDSSDDSKDGEWAGTRHQRKAQSEVRKNPPRRGRSKAATSDVDAGDDVVMLTDSGPSSQRTPKKGIATRPKPRPKSRARGVAASSDMDIELLRASSDDESPKLTSCPRPRIKRPPPRAGQESTLEKENVPTDYSTDYSDAQEIEPPPSNQLKRPPRTRHMDAKSSRAEAPDDDATPRPRKIYPVSSPPSAAATSGTKPNVSFPLMAAKERRAKP